MQVPTVWRQLIETALPHDAELKSEDDFPHVNSPLRCPLHATGSLHRASSVRRRSQWGSHRVIAGESATSPQSTETDQVTARRLRVRVGRAIGRVGPADSAIRMPMER